MIRIFGLIVFAAIEIPEAELPPPTGTMIVSMAKERISDMVDYKGKFVFVETPKAPPAPSFSPSMPLGPRIENLPPKAAAPAVTPVKPVEANSAPKK